MTKTWLVGGAIVSMSLFAASACTNVQNYLDPAGPRFSGHFSRGIPENDGIFKAVSYNIEHSEDLAGAIAELSTVVELQGTDLLMLQEMDEVGVDSIARIVGFNYVYYPANIHSTNNRNFGNAILTRYEIVDDGKVLLPHEDIKREQRRIAVYATIDVDGTFIRAYSVHTENLWMSPNHRFQQADSLVKSIPKGLTHVIVGGDFNTADPLTLAATGKLFSDNGFVWNTREVGSTVTIGPVGVISDFIFSRGFRQLGAGRVEEATASDHLPVWTDLEFNTER